MDESWLEELNEAQRRAARHAGGPLLIIAGAGSGKTKTLACRVAWLIAQGVSPDRILLLTFTRRAAAEMIERARRLTGAAHAGQVWGGTFHAVANRLLRQYGRALGLSPEFTVTDQADAADLLNLVRGELGYSQVKRRFPQKNTLAALYSRTVNSRTPLSEVTRRHYPWCEESLEGIREIFEAFTRRKREQNVLDYDDLLLYWNALCAVPGLGEVVADRFDQILVDEYQDTNTIQAEILLGMRRSRKDITVVGDDAQSIYSFRSATVRNILDFPRQFPDTTVITLEQNYRSVQPILDASNAVMAPAKERYTKELFTRRGGGGRPLLVTCQDEPEQCREVCERVLARREEGTDLRKQAVLFRAGHNSDQLEVELTRRNIPFVKYGGLKFVEAAHIKDLIAILRILDNPGDEVSWYRVLQLLEGTGPAAARRIMEGLGVRGGGPAPEECAAGAAAGPLHRLLFHPPSVPPAAREAFRELRLAAADCLGIRAPADPRGPCPEDGGARREELPVASQLERLRKFYEPLFHRAYDNAAVRLRDIEQLQQIAGRYPSRTALITDLTLDPPASTQDLAGPPLLDEEYLILSTIHSAKGCEWDAVHLIHASDGVIPSDMATGSDEEIEEERRLLYVAMTRARDALTLYFPLRYYHAGRGRSDRHSYAQLTRFIPKSSYPLFERCGVEVASRREEHEEQEAPIPPAAAASVDALLNSLWRG
jgi:DNA helicase II / ATP-dependent DNA helicase PcrA